MDLFFLLKNFFADDVALDKRLAQFPFCRLETGNIARQSLSLRSPDP
jgi:hypothetical protein